MSAKYPSLAVVGGLFSADLIDDIAEAKADGQHPRDFGFPDHTHLIDQISASWADARGFWQSFRRRLDSLQAGETGVSFTRAQWIVPLFSLLGYDLTYQERAAEADGQSYAISHRADGKEPAPPVHVVGAGQSLDRRAESGRPRLAPHSLVQEYLNGTEHLWGIATNGLTLRLLRDSQLLRRQAYIEFDLRTLFEGDHFADFALLYRLLHRSRLPHADEKPEACLLERWYTQTVEQGGRVRERLRDGVEEAIKKLANGLLRHPHNTDLRQAAHEGKLQPARLYEQLLRLIYRLLFLMVTEERNLLSSHPVYREHYSVSRLRRLAELPQARNQHDDLWMGLQSTFRLFHSQELGRLLDVPPLDGELFDLNRTEDLNSAYLANHDFLEAFWHLSTYREDRRALPRRINYAALDVEELGSVYESLLDLQPVFTHENGQLAFQLIQGTQRKTTGSYYTHPELVEELVKSALVPVIEDRLAEARRLANGEWRTQEEQQRVHSVLSRFGSLAAGHGAGRTALPLDSDVSQARTLRPDVADPAGGGFYSGQHRGGLGPSGDRGISTVSSDRFRESARTGNSPAPGAEGLPVQTRASGPLAGHDRHRLSPDPHPSAPPAGKAPESLTELFRNTPLATRHSLLASHALLAITVCDPACGSGHFLLAAARRLARELAQIRSGEDEPSPREYRLALRDVITHCIYGVDKNPLAVELCKVALWLESHAEGKPLSFLDHRILCGDSLVGVRDLAVLQGGIPDEAFKPVTDDDKDVAKEIKRRNRAALRGQRALPFTAAAEIQELTDLRKALFEIPDDTPEQIREKRKTLERWRSESGRYWRDRTAADLWTCAFFVALTPENLASHSIPTTQELLDYLEGRRPDPRMLAEALSQSVRQRFFHWPLEFPEVFARGGFDVILCNPPWEMLELKEQEFFASRNLKIAAAPNTAARQRLIQELPRRDPTLWNEYQKATHDMDALRKFLRSGGAYLLTATGRINSYSVFAERFTHLVRPQGRVGAVLPTGIATDDTTKEFFASLMESRRLASFLALENEDMFYFPGIHHSFKYGLMTIGGEKAVTAQPSFTFLCRRIEDTRHPERRFTLTEEDIRLLNPNTRTCPVFRTRADAELTKKIYRRVPVLINESAGRNPWGISFRQGLFNMSSDSSLFETEPGPGLVPLYEAKMIHQFDHRYATYEGATQANINEGSLPQPSPKQKEDPTLRVLPRYWVSAQAVEERLTTWHRGWLFGFRRIATGVVERTAIFCLLPRVAAGDSLFFMVFDHAVCAYEAACLLANCTSLAFDYVVRQKLGGANMNYFVVRQLPVFIRSSCTAPRVAYAVPRVLELTCTAWDIQPFLDDVWREADADLRAAIERQWCENREATGGHTYDPPEWYTPPRDRCPLPPFKWDEDRRARLRAELDAYYAKPYGLNRKQLRYILDPADLTAKEIATILDDSEEVADPLDPEGYRGRVEASTFPGETFRVLKEKEMARYGEYRTRRLVLEAWERLNAS
jgi:hypothetical protein